MYFVARLNKTPKKVGTFIDSSIVEDQIEERGIGIGMYLSFNTEELEQIEMQVGLSYTSIENAKVNLQHEAEGKIFNEVQSDAKQRWNQMLNRIYVEGKSNDDKTKFYTGLYHALLGRGLASDVNGEYVKNDGTIGQIPLDDKGEPKYHHHNSDGMWGGFWTLSQLWSLAYPEYMSQYIQSNIDFYKETGWLHDGVAAGVFTNGVSTNFQGLLIAAAYNCGIRDFDIETGYEAALKNEINYSGRNLGNGKYDLRHFVKDGYIPFEDTTISNGWIFNFGSSHTLEYSFSSFAVAQMAKGLRHFDDYQKLMKQSENWTNLYDKETNFIRPRLPNGNFISEFDTLVAWRGFQEGNAFQFTWFVPHDVAGLIQIMGNDLFNQRLENMFNNSQKSMFGGGDEIHSFSGIEKLYNHGNQPCLHNSWLFNYSGKPWLTQKWVRTISNEFYGTKPLHGYGIGQDEDQGMLGAWYVLASIGLFDVQGHAGETPTFQLGSPLFDKITIDLHPDYYKNDKIVIKTKNNSKENLYIQSVKLDDKILDECWIKRTDLLEGEELIIDLSSKPNKDWGINRPPPSQSNL